jgi:hypothetical protein
MEQQDSRLEMIKMFYAYNSWCTEQLIKALDHWKILLSIV